LVGKQTTDVSDKSTSTAQALYTGRMAEEREERSGGAGTDEIGPDNLISVG
jgi:hypothetical protein